MSLTTDPSDPRLGRGADIKPGPQNEVYLILSDDERRKGFVRPLRRAYRHVGYRPTYPLRDLTPEQEEQHGKFGYVKYEEYPQPNPDGSSAIGRYWTQAELEKTACGQETRMGLALCETYARDPHFYGSTYCCACSMHLPIREFVWVEDGQRVGS